MRDSSLDIARGIGILLVIYGHALEVLFLRGDGVFVDSAFEQWRAIYAFHMPLFFLVSGRALALSARREIQWARIGSLVVLAMVNHLIGAALEDLNALWHGEHWTLQTLKYAVKPLLLGREFSLAILWFLISLAAVQLLFSLWRTPRPGAGRPLIVLICVASLVAGTTLGARIPDVFQFKSWLHGLVFFALGYAQLDWKRISIPAAVLCLAAAILLAPLNHGCSFSPNNVCTDAALHGHFAVWMLLGEVGFLPLFYATALLGCAGVMALSPHLESRALAYCGKNSLYLFLVNSYVLAFVVNHLKRYSFGDVGWLGYVAFFAVAVAAHLALLLLTRPFFQRLELVALAVTTWALGWLRRLKLSLTSSAIQQP
jgi:fucose 4-O-acetylase-like acetyltransferase